MRRSAVQRMYEIVTYKKRREALDGQVLTLQAIQQSYKEKVKMAEGSEPISDSFIEAALKVHKVVFSVPAIANLLLFCDSEYNTNNPFDYIFKIEKIMRRAKGEDMTWVFYALHDAWKYNFLSDSSLSTRAIDGKSPGSNGKGVVEVVIYKKKIRDAFIEKMGEIKHWPDAVKIQMRSVTESHKIFREKVAVPGRR
eukprot:6997935-Lingulodinium_polyedra.AAC.1